MKDVVYFLQRSDGLIKIGYSGVFRQRLARLVRSHGPVNVLKVISGTKDDERILHARFIKYHEFGEWFRPSEALLVEIQSIAASGVVPTSISKFEAKRRDGDRHYTELARSAAEDLLRSVCATDGCNAGEAIQIVSDKYEISPNFLNHLLKRKASTVSAFMFAALKAALKVELARHRDLLIEQIERVESDLPPLTPGSVSRKARAQ